MKATLILLGACLFAPIAGALAGNSLNTTPLAAAGDPLATIPRHEADFTGDIAYGGLDAPDHYPLVTRHGTVPVEELIFRGRLRGSYDPYIAPRAVNLDAREPEAPEPVADGLALAPDDSELQRAADVAGLIPVTQPQNARSDVMAALPTGGAAGSLSLAR